MMKFKITIIYKGQNANKEADLLGPTMLDPTPVSHTIVIIIGMIILQIFLYIQ